MEKCIDVSSLEPCEPLERTLEAIRLLNRGDYLRVLHRREPKLLFPLLEKSGFRWVCQAGEASRVEVLIWRAGDARAEREAKSRTHH